MVTKLRKVDYNYEASVIVMNKNRLDLLKKCLESIEKYSQDVNYELIIVDNLSTDGSKEYLLKEWSEKAVVIFEKDPTSYAASNNRVMKWSYGKYIYLMNNDCEARPGWLRKAIDFAEQNPDVGHVASLVLWPDGTVMSHGANLLSTGHTENIGRFRPKEKEKFMKVGNYAYAGFGLYRRDLAEKVGFLPEYNVPIYFDDPGFALAIWELGYDVRYCPDSVIIHTLFHDHNRNHHKELDAIGKGLKYFMGDWGEFLTENKGFFPDYPFTGKRPYKNGEKDKALNLPALVPKREVVSPYIKSDVISNIAENPIENKVVLIISNVVFTDGGGSKRPANLARAFLRKGYKVIFVNLYPSYEKVKFSLNEVEQGEWMKNLTCVSIEDFNVEEFVKEYSSVCKYCLVELPHSKALPIIQYLKNVAPDIRIITEVIDNWNTPLGASWYDEKVEKEIYHLSDRIHVTARELEKVVPAKTEHGKEIRYLPNAVNTLIFDKDKIYERPNDLPPEGKDIVFYMGALWGSWVDFQVIEKAMKKYKDKNFVFCGDGLHPDTFKKWSKLKNCFLLGLKPVSAMPAYVAHSDVCIIPFKFQDDTDIVKYVSPLKLFEYLAMEKPVIATYYPELEGIPNCHLVNNQEEFLKRIGDIKDVPFKREENTKYISVNNWEYRVSQITEEFPLVSVVIPTYNHGQFLKRAVDSVLAQTYTHLEVIVVNDGSTDNTLGVLEEYRDDCRVKVISQENLKLPAALNTGFALAKGDFYTWTSADNKMLPECIETLLNYLLSNPEKGMVYSNYQLIDCEGNPLSEGTCRLKNRSQKDSSCVNLPDKITRENFYLSGDNFIGASFLYHASVAKHIGLYDTGLFGAEDYDYWLRLADKYEVGHCPEVLYKYRVHSDTLNARAKELHIYDNVTKCLKKNSLFRLQSVSSVPYGYKAKPIVFQVEKMVVGGLEKVVYSLIKSIDRAQYEPILFVEESVFGAYGEKLQAEGFQVYLLNKSIDTLKSLLDKLKPVLVNFHYSLFGAQEYIDRKIKTIYTIHNNYVWFGKKFRDCRKKFYDQFDRFIAVSNTVKDYFIKYFDIRSENIKVIPNGHIPMVQSTTRKYFRKDLGFSPSDFVFVTPASITPVKQQNLIIEALKECKSLSARTLFVGGIGDKDFYTALQEKINKNMLRHKAVFLHDVSPEDMFQIYSISNCLLMPSLTEGWSMAVMEAIEAGLPLILSNTGSAPEVITDNGVLYNWFKLNALDINGENLNSLLTPSERNIIRLRAIMEEMIHGSYTYKKNAQKVKPTFLQNHTMPIMIRAYQSEFNALIPKALAI